MNILHVNRFAIYVYWDPQGILRDYALYFVKELKKSCSRVVFIANGFLSSQSKETLLEEGIEVYTRKNFGYDFYAYKYGLDILSPSFHECDELILSNSSVYGPFIPFEKIHTKMDTLNLDFWGISAWKGNPWPTHIQSYFLAFRNRILVSEHFSNYWKNLPSITNRQEAIEKCEVRLTKFFSNYGYSWRVYTEDSEDGDYSIMRAKKSLTSGMPFLKRKYFENCNIKYEEKIATVNIIRSLSSYDINMIYSDYFYTALLSPKKILYLNRFKNAVKKRFPIFIRIHKRFCSHIKQTVEFMQKNSKFKEK